MNWFKRLWNRLLRVFKSFIDEALPVVMQVLIAEFKDAMINIVGRLQSTDLSNEDKRKEAFKDIKLEAARRGKTLSDSVIDILLNLALNYIKNRF